MVENVHLTQKLIQPPLELCWSCQFSLKQCHHSCFKERDFFGYFKIALQNHFYHLKILKLTPYDLLLLGDCEPNLPCALLPHQHLQHPVAQLQLSPLGLRQGGQCVCRLLLQLRKVIGYCVQSSPVGFSLSLLGSGPLLQGLEANHGDWQQPGWIWIVCLSLLPKSGVDACRWRVQVGGNVRLGEGELGHHHLHASCLQLSSLAVEECMQVTRRDFPCASPLLLLCHCEHQLCCPTVATKALNTQDLHLEVGLVAHHLADPRDDPSLPRLHLFSFLLEQETDQPLLVVVLWHGRIPYCFEPKKNHENEISETFRESNLQNGFSGSRATGGAVLL